MANMFSKPYIISLTSKNTEVESIITSILQVRKWKFRPVKRQSWVTFSGRQSKGGFPKESTRRQCRTRGLREETNKLSTARVFMKDSALHCAFNKGRILTR